MQSERWANIGREILFSARSELYMNLPFLDGALAALPVQDGFETSSLATDAKALYFSGAWLAQRFERSRTSVNRAYLHTVFHCLLRHPAKMRGRDRDLWSLTCDIAVESLLDSLDYRCLTPDKTSVRRRSLYRSLHEHMPVLTAEAVYRHFRRERMNSYDCATLTRVFAVDEHTLWPEDDDDQDRRWQQQAQRTQTAMNTVFASEATGGEAVREQLAVSARRTTDYRAFLRFSALREETAIDADSFDYGYYAYGLRRYGNMPLIEPLETRETRKIEDFVIAIDTSASTKDGLVRRFIERTYSILADETSFFSRMNVLVVLTFAFLYKKYDSCKYTMIEMFISSKVVNLVLYGPGVSEVCYIISSNVGAIKSAITCTMGRGVTLLNGEGAWSGREMQVILCVVKRPEIAQLREVVRSVDGKAFVIVSEAKDVFGRGFGNIYGDD